MANLPPKPCSLPYCRKYATQYGRCDDHQRPSGWFKKGSRHSHGYDAKWDVTRDRILVRDKYLCQRCYRSGIYTQAREVDHIVPKSRGGSDDDTNLEGICIRCHMLKTQLERSFPRKAIRPCPPCSVILICGPPGAGKTHYARAKAECRPAGNDVIIDLDDIMQELSGSDREGTDTRLFYRQATSERNRRIDALHDDKYRIAFIIMSLPKSTMRRDWAELLVAEIVLLVPDPYQCEKNIISDPNRGPNAQAKSLEGLNWWFSQHSR